MVDQYQAQGIAHPAIALKINSSPCSHIRIHHLRPHPISSKPTIVLFPWLLSSSPVHRPTHTALSKIPKNVHHEKLRDARARRAGPAASPGKLHLAPSSRRHASPARMAPQRRDTARGARLPVRKSFSSPLLYMSDLDFVLGGASRGSEGTTRSRGLLGTTRSRGLVGGVLVEAGG